MNGNRIAILTLEEINYAIKEYLSNRMTHRLDKNNSEVTFDIRQSNETGTSQPEYSIKSATVDLKFLV